VLEGKPLSLNWTHTKRKGSGDVRPGKLYGLEAEVTIRKTLQLKCVGSISSQPIFITRLNLAQKMPAGKELVNRRT
jgi:hypothetical protein